MTKHISSHHQNFCALVNYTVGALFLPIAAPLPLEPVRWGFNSVWYTVQQTGMMEWCWRCHNDTHSVVYWICFSPKTIKRNHKSPIFLRCLFSWWVYQQPIVSTIVLLLENGKSCLFNKKQNFQYKVFVDTPQMTLKDAQMTVLGVWSFTCLILTQIYYWALHFFSQTQCQQ